MASPAAAVSVRPDVTSALSVAWGSRGGANLTGMTVSRWGNLKTVGIAWSITE